MVQDNHLSHETSCLHWWIVFAVTSHIATTNIFDRYVLDIEAHIVPRKSLTQSFMLSPATLPRRTSLTDTFLTLKPTLSPGRASLKASWCISTDLTSAVTLTGAKVTTMPGLRTPVTTRPTRTVPIPPIL
uniref:Uncharacterized protein n=1 Tax=Ursus maritimus TaxID=29073 RepID=A0A452VP38_URSMA